jgi:hypothetical protein
MLHFDFKFVTVWLFYIWNNYEQKNLYTLSNHKLYFTNYECDSF